MVEYRVEGLANLSATASAIRSAGHKNLEQKLHARLRRAARHVEDAVRDSSDEYMPANYERTFAGALVVRIRNRTVGRGAGVAIIFSGQGQKGLTRDLASLEAGDLRHPVFGRTRRIRQHWKTRTKTIRGKQVSWRGTTYNNPWVEQKIKAGFVTTPGHRAEPLTRAEIVAAVNDANAQLRKG